MDDESNEFSKRLRDTGGWSDDETSIDAEIQKLPKLLSNKKRRVIREKQEYEKRSNSSDDEEMVFGNKISLEDDDRLLDPDISKTKKQISTGELKTIEKEVEMFENDIKSKGIDVLDDNERDEYNLKRKLLSVVEENQNSSGGYILPEDYVTEDGKIDIQKKAAMFRNQRKNDRKESENQWFDKQLNSAQKVNQLSNLKKGQQTEESEKDYEYVFDKSNMINYIPDIPEDEMKELENRIELEEMIEQEENRIRTIDEVKKSLPVYEYRDDLLEAVSKYPVLIVVGETGSGKTTQLPQYLYESGYCKGSKIVGCTQPRRVAAVSVATRVADEVGTNLGDKVGYSIRFEEKCSKNTAIKYMTDGMLVREFLTDSNLEKYSVMIIDEAHERTLQTDILLGLLKDLLKRRPDFKLIISSATINAKKFSDYFDKAPIFNVPGRKYPVEIFYTEQAEANYLYAAITTVFQIHMSTKGAGDILVFLTGQEEIETMAEALEDTCKKLQGQIKEMVICPIYANLPPEKQKKIFDPTPKGARKVVISTNIAETSLTIDGIVYVIDSGYVKENVYSASTGMESLEVVPCSRASADQRAGRAGRVGPGKCFRLYTKWTFLNDLNSNPTPEILRTELTSVVLLMMTLGITDLIHFDFMDRPKTNALVKALELLYALGALNEKGELSYIGMKMASFPTKPMMSKCLLASKDLQCCEEIISVVAMLEESGALFIRSKDKKELAENAHKRFTSKIGGDHLTLLNIWQQFAESGYSSQWCHDNFLQYKTLQRARKIRGQLRRICVRLGLISADQPAPSTADALTASLRVMKAVAAGYFLQSARLSESGRHYETLVGNRPVLVHPSSTLSHAAPPVRALVFHEIVHTSRAFLRHVMPVQGKWLQEFGGHCLKRESVDGL